MLLYVSHPFPLLAPAPSLLSQNSILETSTNSASHYQLTQNQFDALVSFAFNLGCGNLANIARTLNTGNYAAATTQMKQYVNAGGSPLPGLVRRRQAEVDLFNQ